MWKEKRLKIIDNQPFGFVIPKRFERLTHALEGRCSIQLSYGTILNCDAKVRLFLELTNFSALFFEKIYFLVFYNICYRLSKNLKKAKKFLMLTDSRLILAII